MTVSRRLLLMAIVPAMMMSAQVVRADDSSPWDGTWSGSLGKSNPWQISVTIAQGKVVSYTEKGAAFDVNYTKASPTVITFGDRKHYSMKLTKTGDATAEARIHGRMGYGVGSLTRS
jgi:hypothetical protein